MLTSRLLTKKKERPAHLVVNIHVNSAEMSSFSLGQQRIKFEHCTSNKTKLKVTKGTSNPAKAIK